MTGDGVDDVVVAGTGIVEVFPGTGTQRLGERLVSVSWGEPAGTLTVVDFDHDGALDVVGGALTAYLQRGDNSGFFGAATGLWSSTGWNGWSPGPAVLAADVTQDGLPDVLIGREANVWIRPGLGGGATDSAYSVPVPCKWAIAVADMNGDAVPDVLASDDDSVWRFVAGTGSGAFAPAVDVGPGGETLFVVDADGDGSLDVVCGGHFYRGGGDGSFAFQGSLGFEPDAVEDLDDDGWLDVVTLDARSVTVRFGTSAWTFGPPQSWWTGDTPVDVAAGDLDDDGVRDLAVACKGSSSIVVLFGSSPRGFVQPDQFLAGDGPTAMAAAEFTGDAHLDLVTANRRDRTVTVLENLGGSFAAPIVHPAAAGIRDLALADLDGDGRQDVLTVSDTAAVLSVFAGQVGGGLAPRVDHPAGTQPTAIAVGNLNGDAYLDVAVLEGELQRFLVLFGTASGFSASPPLGSTSERGDDILILDADGDGLQDVLVHYSKRSFSSGAQYFRGDGAGGFPARHDLTRTWGRGVLESADASGDGIPDLSIASEHDSSTSIASRLWVRDGASAPLPFAYLSGPDSIGPGVTDLGFADLDGDGTPDALTTSPLSNAVTVRLGLGGGAFGARTDYVAGPGLTALVAEDFDGDGDIDVATANGGSNTVSLLLNLTPNGPTPTLAALVDASALPTGVDITWQVETDGMVEVQRRVETSDWLAVASLSPDGSRRLHLKDTDIAPGERYGYRLRWMDPRGRDVLAGEVWLHVPERASLALHGASPNPARGTVHAAFSLPDDSPATLELIDLAGRRISRTSVGPLGVGEHRVALPASRARPGLYFLRLTRHGVTMTRRVALTQ